MKTKEYYVSPEFNIFGLEHILPVCTSGGKYEAETDIEFDSDSD